MGPSLLFINFFRQVLWFILLVYVDFLAKVWREEFFPRTFVALTFGVQVVAARTSSDEASNEVVMFPEEMNLYLV